MVPEDDGKPISTPPVFSQTYAVVPPEFTVVKLISSIISSPLQTTTSDTSFICAVGVTVIVKVSVGPVQLISLLVYVGVTVIVETSGEVPAVAVKLGIFPFPDASKPVAVLLFVHA